MKHSEQPDVSLKTQDLHKVLEYLDSGENVRPGSQELGTGYSFLYSTLGHVHHQHGLQGAGNDFGSGSGGSGGGGGVSGFQGCAGFVSNGVMSASTVNLASFGNGGNSGNGNGGSGGGSGSNSTSGGGGGSSHGHGHGHNSSSNNSSNARRVCTLPEDITTGVFSRSQTVSPHITLDNRAIRSILTRQKATQERMREETERHDKNLFISIDEEKEENSDNNADNDDDSEEEEEDEEEEEEDENENEVREGEEGADEATKAALRKIRRACGCECKELVTLVLNNLGGAAFPDTISEVLFELPIVSEYNASIANDCKKKRKRTMGATAQQQQHQRKKKKALGRGEVRLAVGFCLDRDRDAFVQYALGRQRDRSFWVLGEYLLGFATEGELTEIRDHETPELEGIPLVAYEDMSFHSCSSVANSAKYDTLHGAILRFLENESLYAAQDRAARGAGLSHEDDVVDFVLSNWCRPHRDVTDDVLRSEVLATLRTSPLFAQSPSCPGFWRPAPLAAQVLPKEWRFSQDVLSGRRPVRSARDGTTVAAASLSLAAAIVMTEREAQRQGKAFPASLPNGGGANAGSASGSSAQSGGKKHKPAPPVGSDGDSASGNNNNDGGNSGYASPNINSCGAGDKDGDQGAGLRDEPRFLLCSRCGADIPGRGPCAGWKIGQHRNDVLCVACCVLVDITTSCMICGKQYSLEDDAEDEGENGWIGCDGCHRWAMVRCDPSIRDINEYKANSKKYFCPYCVRHRHQAQYFQFLAESSEKNSPSSLVMPADGCCCGCSGGATAEPHEPCQKRARTLPDEEGCETDEYVEEAVAHFTDEVFPALLAENDRALTLEQKDEVAAFKDVLAKKIRYTLREKVKAHNEQVRRLNTDLAIQISCALRDFECVFREHLEKSFATKQSTGYKR